MSALTYAQAGVDRDAADRLAGRIGQMVKRLGGLKASKRVRSSVGGYASLFEGSRSQWIAASTDGVGTKLKLAFRLGVHDTVGIDLVAMSVNDLLCVGAEPWFFLDYFATGRLDSRVAEKVLEGVIEGCAQAECALVGGETAEMPALYSEGEYDLAGFAVGGLKPAEVLPRARALKPGAVLLGLASSGAHSNGFSLLRKLIPEGPAGDAVARQLLTPTRIYVKSVAPQLRRKKLLGLAHITGSGFLNVPRMSNAVSYDLVLPPLRERAGVFEWIYRASNLPLEELAQTFNLGVGMVVAVDPKSAASVRKALQKSGETVWELGQVTKQRPGKGCEVRVREGNQEVWLTY